ncbi:hypothetical protein RFI_25669, partial [Reticulomyxa filosa]
MPYKAFVSIEKEVHKVTLVFLRLKRLKEKVLEVINTTKNGNDKIDFKIVDNNSQDIAILFLFFIQLFVCFFYFKTKLIYKLDNDDNDEKKYPEDEKENEFYRIVNPLVILTGASKYKSLDDLHEVKVDLMILRNLFEKVYGYEVHCTYDPNKPETESLTLKQLNRFLIKHYTNLVKANNNEKNYDSLIFFWCGYCNTTSKEGYILITSDDNRYKPFKKIQELFTSDINKPKIYIKNAYRVNEQPQQQYNCGSNTFIITSTIPEKLILNSINSDKEKGSHFAECFCNVMSQNIKLSKSLDDNLILISKLVKQKALNGQIIQITTTRNRNVFLCLNSNNYLLNTNTEIDKDHSWNKANNKAHKMVNEMINTKQQGIVVVATNLDKLEKSNHRLSQDNIPFSMMINSNQYMKQKLIIGPYAISSFYSKNITFDNITIDGSVYVVDCTIDGFGNCHITQQLIPTNQSIIRYHFRSHVFTCPWPIDIKNLTKLGKNTLEISKLNEAIQLLRFVLCFRLQTLYDSHIDVAKSYARLGRAYKKKGEYDKAIEYYEKSLKIRLSKLGSDHPIVAISYNNFGV